MKAFIFLTTFLFSTLASAQKRQMVANWSEKYASIQALEIGNENSVAMIGLGVEMRFEKHSLLNQISFVQKTENTPSLSNYSYGYSFGPDWDLPFEPRVDLKGGISFFQREESRSLHPSVAAKFRISTLKMSPFSLNLFVEVGDLGVGYRYYSSGVSINFGGPE